jgi:transcription antitermination factor NusG
MAEVRASPNAGGMDAQDGRYWYAVFTVPRSEKSVVKHLDIQDIESFLPICETVRVWKNRQRVKVVLPLFPTYLFVNIDSRERTKVLQSPGVLQIVGKSGKGIPVPDSEVEFLRSGCCRGRIEPYREFVVGERMRIARGPMEGVQGTLVRRNGSMKFVLTIELINQHASVQVDAEDLEPVLT